MLTDLLDLKEQILSWKIKYGDVFYLKIKDNFFIFKTLTRGGHLNIVSMQKSMGCNVEDFILESCLLYPEYSLSYMDNLLAGDFDHLLRSIISTSGFSDESNFFKDLDKERSKISVLDNQIVLLVCKAFPHLSLDDINNLNYQQILKYLVLAESILDTKLIIEKPKDNNTINFSEDNQTMSGNILKNFPNLKQKEEI